MTAAALGELISFSLGKGREVKRQGTAAVGTETERERQEMTSGTYQHGKDIFLIFLLEKDEDI